MPPKDGSGAADRRPTRTSWFGAFVHAVPPVKPPPGLGADALLLTEFRGLSVHDATELRRSLGETGFSVVKNTLLKLAAGAAGIAELESAPNPLP